MSRWGREKDGVLRSSYGVVSTQSLARRFRLSVAAIERRALQLFPVVDEPEVPEVVDWTAERQARLCAMLGRVPLPLAARLLGVSRRALGARLVRLRTQPRREGPWSSAEIRTLRLLYSSREDGALALGLCRDVRQVRAMATTLALKKDKGFAKRRAPDLTTRMPPWTDGEVAYLQTKFPVESSRAIALRLGRSEKAVASKARHLGLSKSTERRRAAARAARHNLRQSP